MLRRLLLVRPRRCTSGARPSTTPKSVNTSASEPSGSGGGASKAVGILVFGGITVSTGYLGVWQLQRYYWKQDVIDQRLKSLEAPPVPLPDSLSEQEELLYRRVTLTGTYDFEHQAFVGPRGPPKGAPPSLSRGSDAVGFYVVTPLQTGTGGRVLVNRGWVGRSLIDAGDERVNAQLPSARPVVGVIRDGEKPSSAVQMTPAQFVDQIPCFLVPDLARMTDTPAAKYIVDFVESFAPGDVMATKQLPSFAEFHVTPFMHLVYAGTWFTLAACGVFMTFLRFRKQPAGLSAVLKGKRVVVPVEKDRMSLPRALLRKLHENAATADQRASTIRSRFNIFDAYSTTRRKFETELEEIQESELLLAEEKGKIIQKMFCARVWQQLHRRSAFLATPTSVWGFLVLLGAFTTILVAMFDFVLNNMILLKVDVFNAITSMSTRWGGVWWVGWTVAWSCAAVSVGVLLTSGADGSGLPQIKSMLAGTPYRGHFSWRVLAAKLIGLQCAMVAGLSIGKEVPFSHISGIIAHKMWRLKWFKAIRESHPLRRQVLAAAVASGTTAVMGAPLGALLFSVEVTATNYLVSNLWRGFLCAVTCAVTFSIIHTFNADLPFRETRFLGHRDFDWNLLLFAIQGVLCGLLASAFVYFTSLMSAFRRSFVSGKFSRYLYAVGVGLLVGYFTWFQPYTQVGDKTNLNALFQLSNATNGKVPLNDEGYVDLFAKFRAGYSGNKFVALGIFWLVKFVGTAVSLSMPMPCGIYLPLLVMSAAFSRLYGEVVNVVFPGSPDAALFAFVGSAATLSGITHSISSCVIVMEMTAQANNGLPLLVCAAVSYTVAGIFTISIYDMFMELARIPYLPYVQNAKLYPLKAKDVMHQQFPYMTMTSTINDALKLLKTKPIKYEDPGVMQEFPLVDSESNMLLLGTVSRAALEAFVNSTAAETGEPLLAARAAFPQTPQTPEAADVRVAINDDAPDDDVPTPRIPRNGNSGVLTHPSVTEGLWRSLMSSETNAGIDTSELVPSPNASRLDFLWPRKLRHRRLLIPPTSIAAPAPLAPIAGMLTPVRTPGSGQHFGLTPLLFNILVYTFHKNNGEGAANITVDPAPFQVPALTAMSMLHYLFAVCMYSRIYVTQQGRLVGIVYKGDFLSEKWLNERYRDPEDDGHVL